MNVALVHDYLTQRGGAERVVLSLTRAFPGAPLYTSLYDADGTFPEFREVDVRPLPINRLVPLRTRHRLALPLLAPAFARLTVEADAVLCSSSGWAHGARVRGRKLVYCYTPARWLYQSDRYLEGGLAAGRAVLPLLKPALLRWDRRAARSADRYLTSSTAVRERIRDAYGIDATIVPPPHTIDPGGPQADVPGVEGGFALCVARLLPYKNVAAVVAAFRALPDLRLVVAGSGPEEARLRADAPPNVTLVGSVTDAQLRRLYADAALLVAASYEDYGLTPLEAAAFGKPAAALRFGGFVDTIVEGRTGVFFERPAPDEIGPAIRRALDRDWDEADLRRHADSYSEPAFIERIRGIAGAELTRDG